jgi:uncharacterized membrane protein
VGVALPASAAPPATAFARAINDAGIVAGQSTANDGSGTAAALAWYQDQSGAWRFLRLGALPGHNLSLARAIGEIDAGGRVLVAGMSARAGSPAKGYRPVRWTLEPDGVGGWRVADMQKLQLPSHIKDADVWGVNTAGEVAGDYFNQWIIYDAATWQSAGTVEALPKPSFQAARARDIDNAGRIVGSVWDDASNSERAALWRR